MTEVFAALEALASSPRNLILALIAAFVAATLLLALLFVAIGRRIARKRREASPDPLKRGRGPIGLARLRDAAISGVLAPSEPRLERFEQSDAPEAPSNAARGLLGTPLMTLPFRAVPGLASAGAELCGMRVEAIFFDPDRFNALENLVERLAPFLPAEACEVLAVEADRETVRSGPLFAQADAVVRVPGGLAVIEYKSRGGRLDDPTDWQRTIRVKDLLQTLLIALAVSRVKGEPAAALLRTHNAVYFLRPQPELVDFLASGVGPGAEFLRSLGDERTGINASDLAGLLAVPLSKRFPKNPSVSERAGEIAHRQMFER